jgi:hypothetical protein
MQRAYSYLGSISNGRMEDARPGPLRYMLRITSWISSTLPSSFHRYSNRKDL